MIATVTLNPSLDEWMHVPSLRVGQLHRARSFARYPGGKGINVSRVIHELGGHTVAFGLAGGEDGLILRVLLNRLAIPHTFVAVNGLTRNNYKIVTAHPRALTEINLEGPAVPPAGLRALQRQLFTHAPAPQCVVLSGSLPPAVPPSTYRRWITGLHRLRIPSVLDTSGTPLREGLAARPWLIKPNRPEAEAILKRRLLHRNALVNAAQRLLQLGPSVAVLSLGAEGALMATADPAAVWFAKPPTVKTRSAVGAGDSLVGGLVWRWASGATLVEAFRWGVASGTATAMTPGTELCHRAAVRRLVPRVSIRRLV